MTDRRVGLWVIIVVGLILATLVGYRWFRGGPDEQSSPAEDALKLQLGEEAARVVEQRKTWDLDFRPWIGKEAGDLVVTGLDGKEIKLSDYRGKEVAVVFWATWCPACNVEIPHLIELRNTVGPEELAILAVSNEPADVLRLFVEEKGINYNVAMVGSDLPEPFSGVQGIPTTFFIDSEGKVKLAAVGLVSFEDSLAIVEAGS